MLSLISILLAAAALPQEAVADDWPTFEVRDIEGWQVHVNEQAHAAHRPFVDAALEHLRWQLYATSLVLPRTSLVKVREVPIWVEYKTKTACMSFHPGRQWLTDRGYQPPELPSVVELANASNFLTWTRQQPWMVLHELAHGYDFIIIGERRSYGDGRMNGPHQAAVESGKYDSVRHWNGGSSRHYALNNPMEHLAEATEAYFGINDFQPFVRAELREFDPVTAAMIEELWEVDLPAERKLEAELAAALESPAHISPADAWPGAPRTVTLDGWTVRLHPDLVVEEELSEQILEAIGHELHLAGRYLPKVAFDELRQVTIAVLLASEGIPYITSDGEGTGSIAIGRARDFLAWKAIEPCILIRELAALYYDREVAPVEASRQAVAEALRRVAEADLYGSVLRFDGQRVPHPALRDSRSFFAEMSESYFLGNDHFPFVRAELMNHDRETFELIARLWNPPTAK